MTYRLYIVGPVMTREEFEVAKADLPTIELDDLTTALAAATDYLNTGLNAVIEGDDGTRLDAHEIRVAIRSQKK